MAAAALSPTAPPGAGVAPSAEGKANCFAGSGAGGADGPSAQSGATAPADFPLYDAPAKTHGEPMTPKPRRPLNVVRCQPYLRRDDWKRLADHCAANRTTASAVIREALACYLAPTETEDATMILGRVDRVLRAQTRTQRDLELLTEAFGVFVKFWFAHTPAVADTARKAAWTMADARFKQFVDYVSTQFGAGRRFVDDLPRDVLADDHELAELAGTGTPEPTKPSSPDASGTPAGAVETGSRR